MSKLLDRLHIHHQAPERVHEVPAHVPESREVQEHREREAAPPPRAARGVRWLRWLAAIALLGAGIVTVTMLVRDDGTDVIQDVSSQQLVQESIDEALAANRPEVSSYELVQDSIDQALAANRPVLAWPNVTTGPGSNSLGPTPLPVPPVNSYELVQEAIDQALAANQITTLDRAVLDLERNATPQVSSYQLVQDEIDKALAANDFAPWLTPTGGPGSTQLGPTDFD